MAKNNDESKNDTDLSELREWFRSSDDVRQGFVRGATFGYKPVTYSVVDGKAIFEGDIVLGRVGDIPRDPPDSLTGPRSVSGLAYGVAITGEDYRWPNGIIPYEIDAAVPNNVRTIITNAITHWHDNTNIRLIPRTTQDDFVRFISDTGCWSYVGRRGGMQEISIGAGCEFGAAVHEIGHCAGLWHEQSREDRNSHIRILTENIADGRASQFNQHITDGDDIGDYDYGSIMHYGRFAFTKNGQPTIEVLDPNTPQIGQRNGLSEGDIAAIRALYPQLERPPQTTRLFRYWNPSRGDHFYTTSWDELGAGRNGWVYERVACYIFPRPATGSAPLFRYYNSTLTDHFYTTNWNELRTGRAGWVLERIAGYIFPTRQPGTIPLYRYWNPNNTDHFYTTSWGELGAGRLGYRYEGVQGYVYALPPAGADEIDPLSVTEQSGHVPGAAEEIAPPASFEAWESVEFQGSAGLSEGYSSVQDSFKVKPQESGNDGDEVAQGMTIHLHFHQG